MPDPKRRDGASSVNGAAFRPDAAKLIGTAVADALACTLPQALAQVLSSVPVQAVTQQHLCATCLLQRMSWEGAHKTAMDAALAAAAAAAGLPEDDFLRRGGDPSAFLPEHLRPGAQPAGMPAVNPAATTFQGTEVCPLHLPGVQPGRRPLLVAQAGLNLAALAGA